MRVRFALIPTSILVSLMVGFGVWHAQLIHVAPWSGTPHPLALLPAGERAEQTCDVVLPVVPVGLTRLRSADRPLLIHYWAPWELHGRAQATALDSLARRYEGRDLRIVLVTFDPFPSIARFVARQRLRVTVLLDGPGLLRASVPCPALPYTVLLDRDGRAAVSQSGEVDWLAPETARVLERVLAEPNTERRGGHIS
jgi:thiol-disulfide isomerase/thioredoxin